MRYKHTFHRSSSHCAEARLCYRQLERAGQPSEHKDVFEQKRTQLVQKHQVLVERMQALREQSTNKSGWDAYISEMSTEFNKWNGYTYEQFKSGDHEKVHRYLEKLLNEYDAHIKPREEKAKAAQEQKRLEEQKERTDLEKHIQIITEHITTQRDAFDSTSEVKGWNEWNNWNNGIAYYEDAYTQASDTTKKEIQKQWQEYVAEYARLLEVDLSQEPERTTNEEKRPAIQRKKRSTESTINTKVDRQSPHNEQDTTDISTKRSLPNAPTPEPQVQTVPDTTFPRQKIETGQINGSTPSSVIPEIYKPKVVDGRVFPGESKKVERSIEERKNALRKADPATLTEKEQDEQNDILAKDKDVERNGILKALEAEFGVAVSVNEIIFRDNDVWKNIIPVIRETLSNVAQDPDKAAALKRLTSIIVTGEQSLQSTGLQNSTDAGNTYIYVRKGTNIAATIERGAKQLTQRTALEKKYRAEIDSRIPSDINVSNANLEALLKNAKVALSLLPNTVSKKDIHFVVVEPRTGNDGVQYGSWGMEIGINHEQTAEQIRDSILKALEK